MNKSFFGAGVLLAAFSVQVGCSGGSSGTSADSADLERVARDFEALADEVYGYSPTTFSAMPVAGSAGFSGQAVVLMAESDNPDAGVAMIGDATLTADFTDKQVTGAVTNLIGSTELDPTDDDVFVARGSILIGGRASTIGEDNTPADLSLPNEWASDYEGAITTPLGVAQFDGVMTGQFLGTRASPAPGQSVVRAIEGEGEQTGIRMGGKTYDSFIGVVAKN